MAIQILPRTPGFGEVLGTSLGQLLGSGLSGAATGYAQKRGQQELQQQAQAEKQKQSQFYQSIGLPPSLVYQSPQVQNQFIKSWAEEGGLEKLLGGEQVEPTQAAAIPGQQAAEQQNLLQLVQQLEGAQEARLPQGPMSGIDRLQSIIGQARGPEQALIDQLKQRQAIQPKQPAPQAQVDIQPSTNEPAYNLMKFSEGRTPGQRKRFDHALKRQERISKEFLPIYQNKIKKGQFAEEILPILKKQAKIVLEGKLPGQIAQAKAALAKAPKGIAAVIGGILGGKTGAFAAAALIPNFDATAKAILGDAAGELLAYNTDLFGIVKAAVGDGRITNTEFNKITEAALIRLSDTPKTMISKINRFWRKYSRDLVVGDAAGELRDKNAGYIPSNFDSKLKIIVRPQLKEIDKQFKRGTLGFKYKAPEVAKTSKNRRQERLRSLVSGGLPF